MEPNSILSIEAKRLNVGSNVSSIGSGKGANNGKLNAIVDSSGSYKEQRRTWATCTPLRATANIWRHFRVYTDNRCPNLAVCMYCRAEVPRGKDRSTTPLRSHLQHHHRDTLNETCIETMKAESFGGDYGGKVKTEVRFEPAMALLDSYLKMILYCHLSQDLCESPYFKRLIKTANPRATLPEIQLVRHRLNEAEGHIRSLTKTQFKGQSMAISSYGWTSKNGLSYRIFSLHSINESWELISLPLDVCKWTEKSAFEEQFGKLMFTNEIENSQISAIVLDSNCSTMAGENCLEAPSFSCLNHLIARVTKNYFSHPGVSEALKVSKDFCAYFNENPQEIVKLEQYCAQRDVPFVPIYPSRSNIWWSVCLHCKWMIMMQPILVSLPFPIPHNLVLMDSHWNTLKAGTLLLEPFMAVYRLLQGERHVTLSLVPFLVSQVQASLQFASSSTELPSTFSHVASSMLYELGVFFGKDSSKLPVPVLMAAALDPRTKLLTGIPPLEHEEVWEKVVIAVRDMVLADIDQARRTVAPAQPAKWEPDEDAPSHGDSLFALLAGGTPPLLNRYPPVPSSIPSTEDIVGMAKRRASWEVDQYRIAPILAHEEMSRANPLEWYRDRELLFPAVARLARHVLCVPAITSVEMLSEKGISQFEERIGLANENIIQSSFLEAACWPDVLLNPKFANSVAAARVADRRGRGKTSHFSLVKEEEKNFMGELKQSSISSVGEDEKLASVEGMNCQKRAKCESREENVSEDETKQLEGIEHQEIDKDPMLMGP